MPGDATKVDEVTHEGNRSRTRLWVGMILLGALVALLAAVAVACGEAVTETTVPPATDATTTAVTPASLNRSRRLAAIRRCVIAHLEYASPAWASRRTGSPSSGLQGRSGALGGNVEVFPATPTASAPVLPGAPDDGRSFPTSSPRWPPSRIDSTSKPLWVLRRARTSAGPLWWQSKQATHPGGGTV